MPPPQALGQEELVDAAALDADALPLIEIGLQSVRRPAGEGQAQAPRGGQRRGDDLGALLGRIGRGAPGPGLVLQAAEPLVIEAMDPGVDRRSRDAQLLGHLAGAASVGDGQEEPGPLDEAGLRGARVGKVLEGLAFLGRQFPEGDLGEDHGCTSIRSKDTPLLRQTEGVSSLAGCTTKRNRILFLWI